jgi:Arabinose efflux permease
MQTQEPANGDAAAQSPAICRTPAKPVTKTEKHIVLLIAILAGFLTPFDGSAVNIALPTIGTQFHMDAIALSWVATAYILASALFLVPFGKIADIYGRKKIFLCGLAVFGAASFVMTLVATEQQMIGVRVLQGIGAAMIFGTSVAILTAVYPPGERGKALGIYITSVYLGLTVGPFAGGILTDIFGWQTIFYLNIPHCHRCDCPRPVETQRRVGGMRRRTLRSHRLADLQYRPRGAHVRVLRPPGPVRVHSWQPVSGFWSLCLVRAAQPARFST